MLTYILRRAGLGLTVILATLAATFTLFFAGPGDPARAMCSQRCEPETLARITSNLGLDRPFITQFAEYFKGLFMGRDFTFAGDTVHCSAPCLGMSFSTNRPVTDEVLSRFPATALLAFGAVLVFLIVGLTLGVVAATSRGTSLDRLVVGASQVFGAIPYYVVALIVALYLTRKYAVLPQAVSMSEGLFAFLPGLIAPCLTLGLVTSTAYTRYTRNSMIEVLSTDYIRTARSKGIGERRVLVRHGLHAALSPIVTILGLDVAALLSGTVITEQIFDIDGIGRQAITALGNDDLPIIMGTVLIGATVVVCMNLMVDIAYSFIDPRVRLS